MKQLGKNLAVDVDAKAIQASFASAGSKLASIDTSGIDRAVQKASANAAKKLSSVDLDAVAKKAASQAERAAKSVDTQALQKLSANVNSCVEINQ